MLTPEQRHRRARIAARARHTPEHPQLVEDRRDLRADRLEEHVREVVASLPPLTDEQRRRISSLLRPTGGGGTAA